MFRMRTRNVYGELFQFQRKWEKAAFGLLFGLRSLRSLFLQTLEFCESFFLILMFCPLRRWQNSWNSIFERASDRNKNQAKTLRFSIIFVILPSFCSYSWCPCDSVGKRDIKPCKSSTSAICLVCRTNFAYVCVSVFFSLTLFLCVCTRK